MTRLPPAPLTVRQRHDARGRLYVNVRLWAIGNGLCGTTLITYLAVELGATREGLGIALILAARHVVGLLRLGAPAIIGRWIDRKRFCIGAYLLSTLVLALLPVLAAPGRWSTADRSMAALVICWCLYHVLEYFGTVALWSWMADLVPLRIRGRFLGRRERFLLIGQVGAVLAVALWTWELKQVFPSQPAWVLYAVTAAAGTLVMAVSVWPLVRLPAVAMHRVVQRGASLRDMLRPLMDLRFLGLLTFGCWFSFSNGLTQSAQNLYPLRVLGIGFVMNLGVQTFMRGGQLAISPWVGRLIDRLGNRPVMAVCLLLVANGPLFLLAATPTQLGWWFGAWAAWIAYVGLNIGLPNLMLKLTPRQDDTPYIASYYTLTGLCYAASTLAGGQWLDAQRGATFHLPGGLTFDAYQCSFLVGWLARLFGVALLWLLVVENGRRGKTSRGPISE